jgi:hypothetical protein
MKTYKEIKDIFQRPIIDAVLLKEDGKPPRIIKKDVHKEEWEEYLKSIEEKSKKVRKKK